MEDLIPFLIVVLISIIGAAARKKRKVPFSETVTENDSESDNNDFLSWMEKMVDDRPEPKPFAVKQIDEEEPEEIAVKPYEEGSIRSDVFNNYTGFISPIEHKQMVEKEATRAVVKENSDDLTTQSIKDGEIGNERVNIDFNLKKAVIYSTILNRKYQ